MPDQILVLVAADEELVRLVIRQALRDAGLEVFKPEILASRANSSRRSVMSGDQPGVVHPIRCQAEPPAGLDELEMCARSAVARCICRRVISRGCTG